MRPWKTILCPLDFSHSCARVLDVAAHVAQREGARLVLLHVSDTPAGVPDDLQVMPDPQGAPATAAQLARRDAFRELEQLAAPLGAQGLAVELEFASGAVVATILRAVETVAADLVVMGTHGRRGLAHALLGSVAEQVLRRSPVPVLTVRQLADDEAHATRAEARLDAERDG